jgi:hypothetical protein
VAGGTEAPQMRGWRRRLLAPAALLGLDAVRCGTLAVSTSRSQLARAVIWGEFDVGDSAHFPARPIAAGPTRFSFPRPPAGGGVPPVRTVQAAGKYAQLIYVVPQVQTGPCPLGEDLGPRAPPRLLGDLAGRPNESTSGRAS